jgi:hypothetical protein
MKSKTKNRKREPREAELLDAVKEQLRLRKGVFVETEGGRWCYRVLCGLTAVAIGMLMTLTTKLIIHVRESGAKSVAGALLLLSVQILVFYAARIKTLPSPRIKSERDIKLWLLGRRFLVAAISGFALVVILIVWFNGPGNEPSKALFVVGAIGVFVEALTVLVIVEKPQLFTSAPLIGIGTGAFFVWAPLIPLAFLAGSFKFLGGAKPFDIFHFVGCFFTALYLYPAFWRIKSARTLGRIQYVVVQLVRPERLLHALADHSQIMADQIRAMRIIESLERRRDYGVQLALLETLAKIHKSPSSRRWALMTSAVLFILGAVGQIFFQDLLYKPLIKPLMCKIASSFC